MVERGRLSIYQVQQITNKVHYSRQGLRYSYLINTILLLASLINKWTRDGRPLALWSALTVKKKTKTTSREKRPASTNQVLTKEAPKVNKCSIASQWPEKNDLLNKN